MVVMAGSSEACSSTKKPCVLLLVRSPRSGSCHRMRTSMAISSRSVSFHREREIGWVNRELIGRMF